ncbi:uncharacterized protein LOC127778899 isoform X2 [Oryza glaberrima]|uniref:uncharacterized protein LOC127778899 isoform X2 n=1 Tax=Oryza glaberrima TaxID=4538 RepID=UPI00224C33BF|nr:uncharacterized protein LOC127778899 isoform X2 [Oryza glaberrima]
MVERNISIAKSTANDIIIPDPAPEDNARCFLRLFKKWEGYAMSWDLTITAQTLTCMVSFNALRCAKVVLEGRAPELLGMHANPNCVTKYGYFPLHEDAERFSVEMIKLLLRHGASANVRTVGKDVIEDLLPLHIAIENTCLHKYLEDNLSPSQNHLDYIYKLIHLLCLPEMKIFLDTIRLLAGKTNNLLEELWYYIEDGKLIQSAILLLAAQEQIRGGSSSKISSKKDGFGIISKRILRLSFALRWEKGSNGMAQKLLEEKRTLIDCTGLLVDVISQAGEPLSAYVQAHSEAPHVEVLEHVSTILKEYGFYPTAEVIDTMNLQPYDCEMERESCSKDANMAFTETANRHASEEKTRRKEVGGGWDPTYTRRNFFPYWRSVLRTLCPVKVYPVYARANANSGRDLEQIRIFQSNSMANRSTRTQNRMLDSVGRVPPFANNHQSKRSFSTCATGAFRLLKLLKSSVGAPVPLLAGS